MAYHTAQQCWEALAGFKQSLLHRCERYAALTIPKICLPEGFDVQSIDQTHDYQSIGAQATNHLTNKVMLGLFRPSQPFFRIDAGTKTQAELAAAGLEETAIVKALGQAERAAVKTLDERAQRPKLYSTIRHLIVTGNCVLDLGKDQIRVMGLKYYCVKRDSHGKVYTLIIREQVCYDELEQEVKAALTGRYSDDTKVNHYRWIQRDEHGMYNMTQHVDSEQLPEKFNGRWKADDMPYRVLTWDLADESDYGTGLVEEYAGDLEALSALSESVVDGAVLGTEMRWVVNPSGMTTADDLNNSQNGDAIPGLPADIAPVTGGNFQAVTTADQVLSRYERRVAMGFLMQTAVMRDAERVTAEEVRQVAQELETAFGGVYSALAATLQKPVAEWLLASVDLKISDTDLKISVITGLDALSRQGDLENLRLALNDLAGISALPPEFQGRIKFNAIADYVGNGRGIDLSPFLKSEDEYNQWLQQQAQMRVQESNAVAAGDAAAQATAQQGQ